MNLVRYNYTYIKNMVQIKIFTSSNSSSIYKMS